MSLEEPPTHPTNHSSKRLKRWFKAIQKPFFLILLSLILGSYLSFFSHSKQVIHSSLSTGLSKISAILLFFSLLWLVIRLINMLTQELQKWSETHEKSAILLASPLISNALKIIAAWLLINISLPFLFLPAHYLLLANKATFAFLIVFIAWFSIRFIHIFEQFALRRCALKIKDLVNFRKIQTQITVLKKIAVAIVMFLALVFLLMLSDKVRELGATLLASAGIIAAIATFAAQKTLSGVIGGVQIALTQPIHLNDRVVVENELGNIEEITLSYVVIKLQDTRRLIVPVSYFIEKPFLNLSRDLKDIQGKICLFVSYSVCIQRIRELFLEHLQADDKWNKKTAQVTIVDAKPNQIQLEFTMSANDPSSLWELQCTMRENLIVALKSEFPDAFNKN